MSKKDKKSSAAHAANVAESHAGEHVSAEEHKADPAADASPPFDLAGEKAAFLAADEAIKAATVAKDAAMSRLGKWLDAQGKSAKIKIGDTTYFPARKPEKQGGGYTLRTERERAGTVY